MVKILVSGGYGCNVIFLRRDFSLERILDSTPNSPYLFSISKNLERMFFFQDKILLLDANLTLYEVDSSLTPKILWENVYEVIIRGRKAYILGEGELLIYKYKRGFVDFKLVNKNALSEGASIDILGKDVYLLTKGGEIFRNNLRIVKLHSFLNNGKEFYKIRVLSPKDFLISFEDDNGISLVRLQRIRGSWSVDYLIRYVTDPHFETHYRKSNPLVFASMHRRRALRRAKYRSWIEMVIIKVKSKDVLRRILTPSGVDYLYVNQVFYQVPSWFYEIIKNKELPPITRVQFQGGNY